MVNSEKLIVDYLTAETAVRVVTKTPSDITAPWARLMLFDAPSTDGGIGRSIAPYVQIDCYAGKDGDQTTAYQTLESIFDALVDIGNHSHDEGVICGRPDLKWGRSPDTSIEPAMEAYRITGTIWMRDGV